MPAPRMEPIGTEVFPVRRMDETEDLARVRGCLFAFAQSIVAQYVGYPQPVVDKDVITPGGLCLAVRLQVTPLLHGSFITPEGQRQHLARL